MPPVGFEPTISPGERPQIYALDRAAIGTGMFSVYIYIYIYIYVFELFYTVLRFRKKSRDTY